MRKHNELIAREGWPFMAPFLVLAAVSFTLKWPLWVGLLCLLLAGYVAYFFRNPYRQIPGDERDLVSPADGKIVHIGRDEQQRWVISVFLNVFNVHINRCPMQGTISEMTYTEGKFLAAYDPRASSENERNAIRISQGERYVDVTQIAGLIARRIVCWKKKGDQVGRGERYGLIRFGSRMDINLPGDAVLNVAMGQKIRGGSDILARLPEHAHAESLAS